jgi:6-phosphogluconolactonase (cycloisomerase 2 family)
MTIRRRIGAAMGLALALAVPGIATAHSRPAGYVYTETNAASGNAVLGFARAQDGTLTAIGSFATGGTGTGGGLATQGEVILAGGGAWLLAVNAGSNDISVFAVHGDGSLTLTDRASASGLRPVSLAAHDGLVYALDAGGSGNVAAFVLTGGSLTHVAGSDQPLSGNATNPAEISVSPNGRFAMVTERNTNAIDTYVATPDGRLSGPVTSASSGPTPYGFAFDRLGHAIVSEAANSALSSYRVSASGAHVISASVLTGGLAACWVAVTPNGDWAFDANAHGGTISSFAIGPSGGLTLAASVAASTGASSAPLDLGVTSDGGFLYVNVSGAHGVAAFAIGTGGSLTQVGGLTSIPAGASGLAVS